MTAKTPLAEGQMTALRAAFKKLGAGAAATQSRADFQVCCIAGFQTGGVSELANPADLEVGDTAGLETCATAAVSLERVRRA